MTNYTASDFAKAEFARHPDGRVAARTGVDWAQWAFKCSECETDEERNECDGHDFGPDGYMAGNGWVPVQEPCPLTPDAITDEMVERARNAPSFDGRLSPTPRLVREMLTAALTEPPARPEGAEELARLIADTDVGEWDCGDLADALLATGRVRVVTEEQP